MYRKYTKKKRKLYTEIGIANARKKTCRFIFVDLRKGTSMAQGINRERSAELATNTDLLSINK